MVIAERLNRKVTSVMISGNAKAFVTIRTVRKTPLPFDARSAGKTVEIHKGNPCVTRDKTSLPEIASYPSNSV